MVIINNNTGNLVINLPCQPIWPKFCQTKAPHMLSNSPLIHGFMFIGLAHVVISSKSSTETREKAAFQLISFINSAHEMVVEVHLSAINAIGFIVCKDVCPQKLRDDLFLPKLLEFLMSIQ